MNIYHLAQLKEGRILRWIADEQVIERSFNTSVIAVPLRSGAGVLVVEPSSDTAPHNALIISADGRDQIKIKNPEAVNGAICFGDAYYVRDELTLFIFFSSWQMGCVINDEGDVLRTYESR